MSSHFRLLSAFLTKIFAHFGHLGICLYTTEPKCRKMSVWMDALPKPHILGMGRVPIIRSRRAHKMTVMTLEDHSSKSWSHQTQVSSHCLPISTSSCLASSDSPVSLSPPSPPSLCLSCGQLGSSYTHEASPLLRLYHSPYSVGALLCLQM
jgi:hypothetical protein